MAGTNCIFCSIVGGELPCHRVYEDERFLAFLDIRPLNAGHTLVVPKEHYRWTYDVPYFGEYFEAVKKIGLAIMKVLKAESFSMVTLGHEVPHAHVWIVPRFMDDGHDGVIEWENVKVIPDETKAEIAASVRKELGVG